MFNTKPISFYVVVSIHRSTEYMEALHDEWVARRNAFLLETQARNSGSESDDDTMNKKRILNAEKNF